MDIMNYLKNCHLCPRNCGINRIKGETGYCRSAFEVKVARAMLHQWEEPCISAGSGSGAVFFSNCSLSCVFCQNSHISQEGFGKSISIERLSDIYLELQDKGASNINLVSATHYIPQVVVSLRLAKSKGLNLPVVYNSNGYENTDALKLLQGLVDIYLPDIKYYSSEHSIKYSKAKNYLKYASEAVLEMHRQVGSPLFEGEKIKKGIIIRHLLLPGHLSQSKKIMDWIANNLPKDVYISLMSQYVPMYKAANYPEINRKVSWKSYEWLIDYCLALGLENGFIQEQSSAKTIYTPDFNLDGV